MEDPNDGAGSAAPAAPGKRRNPWIWVSAALAVLAAGAVVWALVLQSDLDSAKQDNEQLQAQMDQAAQAGATAADQAAALYRDVAQELDATSEALTTAEQDVAEAKKVGAAAAAAATAATAAAVRARKAVEQADADVAETNQDAEEATGEAEQAQAEVEQTEAKTGKAEAEADEADAERDKAVADAELAQSRAAIAGACAKAYVSALALLLEGDSPRDQVAVVRDRFRAMTADCKAALSGS